MENPIETKERPREEERPLHEDVRWLGSALGDVVARFAGKKAFETVETLRKSCRARRRGEAGAPDLETLITHVDSLDTSELAVVARAFTLFFLLINTAEQV